MFIKDGLANPVLEPLLQDENLKILDAYDKQIAAIIGATVETRIEMSSSYYDVNSWCFFTARRVGSNQLVARFYFKQMPGCCGIMISSDWMIWYMYNGKGLGTLLNKFSLDLGKMLGYTRVFITEKHSHISHIGILKKNGWKVLETFQNKRTENDVSIFLHDC